MCSLKKKGMRLWLGRCAYSKYRAKQLNLIKFRNIDIFKKKKTVSNIFYTDILTQMLYFNKKIYHKKKNKKKFTTKKNALLVWISLLMEKSTNKLYRFSRKKLYYNFRKKNKQTKRLMRKKN